MFRILISLCFIPLSLSAQTPTLDGLLQEARTNWPTLQQKQASSRAAVARLAESKAAYGPQVSFGATYSVAYGGRSIDFPIGDLLNPVYGTLNEITQTQQFPPVENAEVQFLPHNFYDTRVRLQQPIYRPEIKTNQRIRAEQVNLARLAERVTEQTLAYDVRRGYFQYLSARTAVAIYAEAEQLLTEALRTTRSLVDNGKELPLARTSLEAELARTHAEQTTARINVLNAAAYLNYLTGRPLTSPLAPDSLTLLPPTTAEGSITQRAELDQLRTGLRLNDLQQEIEQLHFRPKLGLQLDIGSQDFSFQWNPYVLAGISLEIPLWDNRVHRHRKAALTAERAAGEAQLKQTEQLLQLQATTLRNQLAADRQVYDSYVPAVTAAERSLHDAHRLYVAGQGNYLNIVDARTRLTQARLARNVALYRAWTTYAELLRTYGNQ